MRVFVKDERKFDAAMHAFNETCKKFNEQFKKGGGLNIAGEKVRILDIIYELERGSVTIANEGQRLFII